MTADPPAGPTTTACKICTAKPNPGLLTVFWVAPGLKSQEKRSRKSRQFNLTGCRVEPHAACTGGGPTLQLPIGPAPWRLTFHGHPVPTPIDLYVTHWHRGNLTNVDSFGIPLDSPNGTQSRDAMAEWFGCRTRGYKLHVTLQPGVRIPVLPRVISDVALSSRLSSGGWDPSTLLWI